jgi:alanyl-tRNA synthetase
MDKLGLNTIREKYLQFFESKGHLRLPSFPLIPQGDKGLLIINSGMAPLKPYFSGEVTPPGKRITTCQKCIRTPDIERVGKTSRHGTFFEMLGNFSFGDYFKREACAWAWEFITKILLIPKEKLYVSVYLDDDEAYEIWTKEIGVSPSHMARLGKADNFWEIGAGPCGPCTEIYFDRGAEHGCGSPDCAVGCDCDRYVEFWNLVFTQYYNDGKDNYTPLSQKNIDTGMGLERISCIMQGVNSLFDVDTIMNITKHISKRTGAAYGQNPKTDVSLRIITDHIRSTTMMISDGILPSNEGRGYVLRRLLRRAARHGKLLGMSNPFLYEICETVINESREAYPELEEKRQYIGKVILAEEERFNLTIDAGMRILNGLMDALKSDGKTILDGTECFKLYDTYGFPIDLTIEILEENGLHADIDGFNAGMEEQKERARAATAALGDFGWEALDLGLPKETETLFTGYTSVRENAQILAIISEGEPCSSVLSGQDAILVLDKTPFYAEMGGQTADHGVIASAQGRFIVKDVRKTKDGKVLHSGSVLSGELTVEDSVEARIDEERRRAVMRAHSATHLLHRSLKNKLGSHVEQAGSLVLPDTV